MKKHMILLLSLSVILMIGAPVSAKEKVVVIPLSVGKSVSNIVTVAKSGGDFKDIQKAIDSITDATSSNPYLIVIAPGRYEIKKSIAMKPYVSITGSGQNVTKLEGFIRSIPETKDGAVIQGADQVTLSNISISNTNQYSIDYIYGIYCFGAKMFLKNVKVRVDAGSGQGTLAAAISNRGSSNIYLDNVEADAYGSWAIGLRNFDDGASHVNNSKLSGTYRGVIIDSTRTRIRNTIIDGVVDDSVSGTQCRVVYDSDFTPLGC